MSDENKKPSMTISVTIPEQRISDLLCSAFEGGVGYWAKIVKYDLAAGGVFPEYPHISVPLMEGCAVIVKEHETEKAKPLRLDRAAIERGLKIMAAKYPHHFGNFMDENDDAETGDVFLQCALLGEIVYG